MSIYLNNIKIENIPQFIENTSIPAHQKIGALFHLALDSQGKSKTSAATAFSYLGLLPEDHEAQEVMSKVIENFKSPTEIVCDKNSGVYFIKQLVEDKYENRAVFKIGRKRAEMETFVRRFAHLLGLEKQMIPGIICAFENLPFYSGETIEELWNGNEKLFSDSISEQKSNSSVTEEDSDPGYSSHSSSTSTSPTKKQSSISPKKVSPLYFTMDDLNSPAEEKQQGYSEEDFIEISAPKTAYTIVGILEPFLAQQQERASLYDYTLMTILALSIGLRDGKADGYFGSTWLDVEDCMPIRIDPAFQKGEMVNPVAAIDLPYLDKDDRTNASLSIEEVTRLAEVVNKWDIFTIVEQLQKQKILYADQISEKASSQSSIEDEGHCPVEIYVPEHFHLINGYLNHLSSDNPERYLLLKRQSSACDTRLHRIVDFITEHAINKTTFTPQELVFAVDKYGKIFHDAIRHSPKLPPTYAQIQSGQGTNHIIGRASPDKVQVQLNKESVLRISS